MRIGDKVEVHSAVISDTLFQNSAGKPSHKGEWPERKFTGTVVYIHPELRYFTVRYDLQKGSFCESFKIV